MANLPLDHSPTQHNEDQEPVLTSRRDLLRGAVSIVAGASVPLMAASPVQSAPATPASPTAHAAWHTFECGLANALAELKEDEFLFVSPKRGPLFVQFLDQGVHGLRAEAVSNVYLDEDAQLSPAACTRLVALGWHAPTSGSDEGDGPWPTDIDGSSNFFLDAPPPVPYSVLAKLAVGTLREVYRTGHPGGLHYAAGSLEDASASLRFPALGLKRKEREAW